MEEKVQVKLYLSTELAEALRMAAAKRGGQGSMSNVAEEILRGALLITEINRLIKIGADDIRVTWRGNQGYSIGYVDAGELPVLLDETRHRYAFVHEGVYLSVSGYGGIWYVDGEDWEYAHECAFPGGLRPTLTDPSELDWSYGDEPDPTEEDPDEI